MRLIVLEVMPIIYHYVSVPMVTEDSSSFIFLLEREGESLRIHTVQYIEMIIGLGNNSI